MGAYRKGIKVLAKVNEFSRWKLCTVEAFGEIQDTYAKKDTLWIERGEDWYAMRHYKEPFCILRRDDWLRGEDV